MNSQVQKLLGIVLGIGSVVLSAYMPHGNEMAQHTLLLTGGGLLGSVLVKRPGDSKKS
jgi:flagellar motor component MotA